jgi:acylaminoacyl-peptidase
MQVWASRGWFVFFCNPRGSEGYGEEFADLRGKYGTIDYEDLMEFTDFVLKQYPQIDAARLGAAGGSYGGFMCNWIEGHTDRFAAIASQRSVSNWVSDFGCSEIGVSFDTNEMLATPWNGMEAMWEASPLKYACNAKTPILFIHSLCDYNCTLDQGIQMFTAMKYFGVESRMCLFEGENHSLSRSGKPRHRMRRLQEMTDWFERYLTKQSVSGTDSRK